MQRFLFTLFTAGCLLLSTAGLFAQKQAQPNTKALLKDLALAKEDTNKVTLLDKLAIAYSATNPDKSILYGKQSLALAQRLGWKPGIANACNSLAVSSSATRDYPVAVDYFSKCLKIAEEQGDKDGQKAYLKNIGHIYANNLHDYTKALDYFTKCRKINEDAGNKGGVSETLVEIGIVYFGQKDYAAAMDNFRQALKINEETADKKGAAETLEGISNVYNKQKDYANATDYALRALKLFEETGDMRGAAICQLTLGNIYNSQNDHAKALDYWQNALKLFPATGERGYMAQCLQNIAALYYSQGHYGKALENSGQALKIREEAGDKAGMSVTLANMGNDYQALASNKVNSPLPDTLAALSRDERLQRALACMSRSIVLQKEKEDFDLLTTTYLHLSQVQQLLGDSAASRESFRKYNNYLAGLYNQQKREDVSMKDMQDVFAEKQHSMQEKQQSLQEKQQSMEEEMARKALEYEYETKQAAATTELERQRLKYEEELKESKISADFAQKRMELEKQDAIKAEQLIEAHKQRNYTLIGFGFLALITLGIFNRFSVLRKVKRTLEQKNKEIAAEKENSDMLRVRAENSEKFKQQFLANMSHEIRTPMNAVSGMTELLLEKNPRTDQLSYLQAISKSSDILLHIINDILDLSKIEAGKMDLEKIDFSLSDTLKQVKDTLSHKAEDKGLHLVVSIDDDVTDVLVGDPYRLNQIFINLGGNAIKFTEKGGIEIRVKTLKKDNENVSLEFSVSDTGIGIPEDKVATLFESFTQVNASDTRKYGGTGLGLSISKQLIELQGGVIFVESEPGSGTTFSFVLDYPIGSPEKLKQRASSEKRADGSILNGLRILVADDNEYNRLVVQETLMLKADVTIEMAVNGQDAINMMERNNYDAVLMDVQMPVMNGIDATKHIRQHLPEPGKNTPIIALTASILRNDIDKCIQAGMNSYVPKPFKAWQLIGTLADVTGRKQPAADDVIPRQEEGTHAKFVIEPDRQSVTDFTYLRKFCEGDEARMKKYVGIYLHSVPTFKEKMTAAASAKNLPEVAHQIHAFKPNWMIMGMKSTSELGVKIEHQCAEMNEGAYDNLKLLIEQTDQSVVELEGDEIRMS